MGKIPWRRAWQPTPAFLPGESRGQRSLGGYSPWGRKESDTTEHACTEALDFNSKLFDGDFPSGTKGKESTCQCKRHERHGFDPWVGKIPWSRKWQSTLVFLPGESHGQRSLVGYSPWGREELVMTERLRTQTQRLYLLLSQVVGAILAAENSVPGLR